MSPGTLFVPLATPGLASIGLGAEAVSSGAFNAAEVIAIVVGLLVVAVAGVFTIRSNVAKIWREQAEGEKARNLDLTAQLAAAVVAHAEAAAVLRREANAQSDLKERALVDLDAANKRTDLSPALELLRQILSAVTSHAQSEVPSDTQSH